MADMIDQSNGQANIAFRGSRNDIWHKMGQQMQPGESIESWGKRAGLTWEAVKVLLWAGNNPEDITEADGYRAIQRNDTKHTLGVATDRYQIVQPMQCLETLQQYVDVDPRFEIDTAGSLRQGATVWATATFTNGVKVGGENHVARMLMTTTFDGTGASVLMGTMIRVVCNNTLRAAFGADKGCQIRVRHNTRFDKDKATRDLAAIAESFEHFKAMGEAMQAQHMAKDVTSKFFKAILDIPWDAKKEDVSTRKQNQFADLGAAYRATVREGTPADTSWAALNSVTRYIDHDRSSRGGADAAEGRFVSAQFGSGALLKEKAVHLLTADSEFAELLKQPFVAGITSRDNDVAAMLAQPFRKN